MTDQPDIEAIAAASVRVFARSEIGDCWRWLGARMGKGYGTIRVSGATRVVHRVIWEALVGSIPPGMQMDHRCRVRECVNPDHLEVVSPRTNTLRGYGPSARDARKTECPRGHPYADGNTLITASGARRCSACRSAASRDYRRRMKT